MSNPQFLNDVYTSVRQQWNNVKSGNIEENRFKVISAFVTTDQYGGNVQVLSFGTGSKCATDEKPSAKKLGKVVYDTHAEVVARRALIRLLYDHLEKARCGYYESILERTFSGKYRLKGNKRLYLFVSAPPCGAASLEEGVKDCDTLRVIQKASHAPKAQLSEKSSPDDDLSYSCSDKITMWNMVGVQGSLLSAFIEPIFINGIIIAEAETNTTRDRAYKALYGRVRNNKVPNFAVYCCKAENLIKDFTGNANPRSTDAAPISHNWYQSSRMELINSREGNIYGQNEQESRLCKREFYLQYRKWAQSYLSTYKANATYGESKEAVDNYQKQKKEAKEKFTKLDLGYWLYNSIHYESFKI